MSTTEELLQALIEGGTLDIEPRSRIEAYLKNCVDCCGCEGLPAPRSRVEALLYKLAEVMAGGGSGGEGGGGDTEEIDLAASVKNIIDTTGSAYYLFAGSFTYPKIRWDDEMVAKALHFNTTENALDLSFMFMYNRHITKVPVFDTGKVIANTNYGLIGMFKQCEKLVEAPAINISRLGSAGYLGNTSSMFWECTSLKIVPPYDFSNVENIDYMFHKCTSLETLPKFDLSSVATATYAFNGCSSLTTFPAIDISHIRNVSSMFNGCAALPAIPHCTINAVNGFQYLFANCKALRNAEITIGDVPSQSVAGFLFYYCTALEEVTIHGHTNSARGWFKGCTALKKVIELDLRDAVHSTYGTGEVFANCTNLTECWATNIVQSMQVGSGTAWGHLLTVDSLIHLIYECRDTGSLKTLTVGSANLAKLADVYVKTIDITDEMRAEDDLVDEKLPFVVCESTDEGAMLITQYVSLKNWKLQ